MDMKFGIWNVRSLYRSGSSKSVVREFAKYKLEYRSDGKGVALNQNTIVHFSMEMLIIT
jgi:hypothetical protein